jgi:hypothetical protein
MGDIGVISGRASVDIEEFRVVKIDTAATGGPSASANFTYPAGAAAEGVGVSQMKAEAGDGVPVRTSHGCETFFTLGSGSVALGDDIEVADAVGRVRAISGAGTKNKIGEARDVAATVGEKFIGVLAPEQRDYT